MNLHELIEQRYSVRSYSTEAVSEEQLHYIMECARLAPSAVNFQPWHFYVVSRAEDRAKLQECYNREWFRSAPMYIIACVRHDEEWVRKTDAKAHGQIDIAIAVEHICLAAAEQGLGTCWVCNFDADLCRRHFALPENEEPAVLIPLGHPAAEAAAPTKLRKAMEEIVTRLE